MQTSASLPSAPPPIPEKKPRRRIWPWIIVAIIILLPLGAIGWTGLWNIPVVSAIFGTNKPIDLGVRSSQAALATAKRDNPMTLVGDTSTWYGLAKKKYTGSVPFDDRHSSEEVTSFINLEIGGHRYAKDIQVKFHNGGMELSAFVVPYVKAPVYADINVTKTSNKTVSITLTKAKLGRLTIPTGYYDDISREATEWVNARLAEAEGLSIEQLTYSANEAYFKGTLPATVEQVPGEEYQVGGRDLRAR